jgi:hypothetical protein
MIGAALGLAGMLGKTLIKSGAAGKLASGVGNLFSGKIGKKRKAAKAAKAASNTPITNYSQVNTTTTESPTNQSFFAKNKISLLIGGGAALVIALFLIFKKK